ncbi:MAG: zinc-dependent alcohol dehydrogenase family protein [Terrimicrobiaceae bacterium]
MIFGLMTDHCSAVILESFHPDAEGLTLGTVPVRAPGPGELRLRMLAAPVNPADINIIEGRYGELPALPSVIGNEGCGVVEEIGYQVKGWSPGDLAVVLQRGAWTESLTLEATEAFRLPPGTDPVLGCQLGVNPPTALLLLEQFESLSPGDWIVQNAANSAVGRSVIQIARSRDLKTLNVVRRPELIQELSHLGADVVVTEETELRKSVTSLCHGSRPKLALNAVGGPSALNLAGALEEGHSLVTFGAMSKQPLKIPNGLLIFSDLRFRGFWLTKWKQTASMAERSRVFQILSEMTARGHLALAVHAEYPISQAREAIREASAANRSGKVILRLG